MEEGVRDEEDEEEKAETGGEADRIGGPGGPLGQGASSVMSNRSVGARSETSNSPGLWEAVIPRGERGGQAGEGLESTPRKRQRSRCFLERVGA